MVCSTMISFELCSAYAISFQVFLWPGRKLSIRIECEFEAVLIPTRFFPSFIVEKDVFKTLGVTPMAM